MQNFNEAKKGDNLPIKQADNLPIKQFSTFKWCDFIFGSYIHTGLIFCSHL